MSNDAYIPPADPLIGTRVGEYEILEPIGEGGMGVVYRAIHPVIKKRVAVKVLKPAVAGDEVQVRRLITEAEAVNAIGHRGIIDIFSLGTLPDGRPYIVMEFLDGDALDLWLQRLPNKRVSIEEAVELLLEMCAPLAAAHHANVIHRDLKPSNVFICMQADGTRFIKILDFGLAKRGVGIDGTTKQTNQTTVAGTPDYMAPEQARGLDISPRSDIYALGVIAFELFTGRVPFTGATPMDVMVAHVGTPPPIPNELEPSLPPILNELVIRMLAKPPEMRPQSVEEVRAVLEDALVQMGRPRSRNSGELPAYVPTASPVPMAPPANFQRPPTPQLAPPSPVEISPAGAPMVQPRSRVQLGLMVFGVVLLGVLGTGSLWLYTRDAQVVVPPVPPAKMVTPPVAVVDPPVLVEVDAGVDAGVVEEVVDAGVAKVEVDVAPVPTVRQLKEQLARLDAKAKKRRLPAKVMVKLKALHKLLPKADTEAERVALEAELNSFEHTHFKTTR
ncbi:MAG: serine/threonine protein kinase [Archangium sp.]